MWDLALWASGNWSSCIGSLLGYGKSMSPSLLNCSRKRHPSVTQYICRIYFAPAYNLEEQLTWDIICAGNGCWGCYKVFSLF